MENFSQVESDILNKIKKVSDRNSLDLVKTEIFGKKGIITELFKKIGGLDQSQKKEYASKLNFLKTKVTEVLEKKLANFSLSKSKPAPYHGQSALPWITLPHPSLFCGQDCANWENAFYHCRSRFS